MLFIRNSIPLIVDYKQACTDNTRSQLDEKWPIYIHSSGSLPHVPLLEQASAKCGQVTKIWYEHAETVLLPAPFSTNCHVYPETRAACVDECIQNRMWSSDLKMTSGSIIRIANDTRAPATNKLPPPSILLICAKRCQRPDCFRTEFKPSRMSQTSDNDNSSHDWFEMKATTIKTSTTFVPKLSITDLVVLLGGLVGLWYGVAIIDFYSVAINATEKVCQSKSTELSTTPTADVNQHSPSNALIKPRSNISHGNHSQRPINSTKNSRSRSAVCVQRVSGNSIRPKKKIRRLRSRSTIIVIISI